MNYSIRFIQAELKRKGFDPGPIDGIAGKRTFDALDLVQGLPRSWSNERKLVGFIQLVATAENIEAGKIDGLWGPQTAFAYQSLKELRLTGEPPDPWRPEDIAELNPNNWPSQRRESDLVDHYGEVGKDQTKIEVPYPHVIAWNRAQTVTRITRHRKVADSLVRVLTNVKEHYGKDGIERLRLDIWGGCLNVRRMRGGSRYSMHSWGIAMDYDPENNRLKWGRDRASFAQPQYNRWWEFWEQEGWVSLGRQRNFDWMHVQAAKL